MPRSVRCLECMVCPVIALLWLNVAQNRSLGQVNNRYEGMLSPYTSIVLSLCPVTVMSGVVLPQSLSEVKSNFWYSCVPLSLCRAGIRVCEMAPGVPFSSPLVETLAPCSSRSRAKQGSPYCSALLKHVKALESY